MPPFVKSLVFICENPQCEHSFRARRGDLPGTCPKCHNDVQWRIAMAGEFTRSDLKLLAEAGIKAT